MPGETTGGARPGSPYLQIGTMVGAYRIESFVAHGGMAFVYEATDMRLGRHVALKLLAPPPNQESDFRERFMRESRFAASLDHPNIVPIYEAGEADGLLFIAMRFVGGDNLDNRLQKVTRLDGHQTLAVLAPIADALDMAHAAGLVHRDVKPANILLGETGRGHEHVYLTDFGITKRTSGLTKLTATGNVIGTMSYTAPEQIRGEKLDARTDVYALGCVAYQCLTGVAPFVKDNQWALVYAHLNDEPVPVSDHRPELAAVDQVVARALEKDPANRYNRCEDFTDALRDALIEAGIEDGRTTEMGPGRRSAIAVGSAGPPTGPGTSPAQPTDQPDSPPAGAGEPPAPTPPTPPAGAGGPPPGPPAEELPADSPVPPTAAVAGQQTPPPPDRPGVRSRHRARNRIGRRSTIVAALAGLAVVATLFAILIPLSGSRLEGGTGSAAFPVTTGDASTDTAAAGQPTDTSHEHSQSATGGSKDDKATSSGDVQIATDASTVNPPPETAPATVAPEPAVAIPSVAGDPLGVGQTPGSVTITPNGRFAYVANRGAGTVTVVDTNLDKVSATIPVAAGPPFYVAFTPDGSRAYVSVYNEDRTVNKVAVLDARTTREIRSLDVDKAPYALTVTPDQKYVFVPSHDTARIDVIDTGMDAVVRKIEVPHNPHAIKFSPDGRHAYVANHESNLVSVVDVEAGNVVNTIAVGTSPHSLALSPDGSQLAVACYDSSDVYFVDVASSGIIGTVPVGTHPQDIEYSADGGYVYTANVDANSVSVVDVAHRTVTATIPTTQPTSIAVAPDGRKAYVTNLSAGTLTILNTSA
jgi:YVTN family beta-propeller protein